MTTTQHDAQVDDAPIGSLIWHCSEEDSGPDVGVSIKLADDEMLWLGEITRKLHQDSGCGSLGDDTGWWIIHYRGDDSRPIAKCCDEVAARDLFERLSGALSEQFAQNAKTLSTAAVPPQVPDAGEEERIDAIMRRQGWHDEPSIGNAAARILMSLHAEAEVARLRAELQWIADMQVAFNAHPVGVIETIRERARAALATQERG